MTPLLQTTYSEQRTLLLSLALELYDRFSGAASLRGEVEVRLAGSGEEAYRRPGQACWLFFDLDPGAYTLEVRSAEETPYYLPVDIPVVLPMPDPLWPAYPDRSLADLNLPLDDPAQPVPYRDQRALATLQPAVAYPFPSATLVRGTVFAAGSPLADARVRRLGDDLEYHTGDGGEFVLFFSDIQGTGETITLRTSHAAFADVDVLVDVRRGMTVASAITMV